MAAESRRTRSMVGIPTRALMLAVFGALILGSAYARQSSAVPLSLDINPTKKQVAAGGEVRIAIKLTNISDKPIIVEDNGVFPYRVNVRRADGNPVVETERGKDM